MATFGRKSRDRKCDITRAPSHTDGTRSTSLFPQENPPHPVSLAENWFLSAQERGNSASMIGNTPGDGSAWTEGNVVEPLIHGKTYFARLYEELSALGPGAKVCFLAWRVDADQRLAGPDTELSNVLVKAASRGVGLRGLIWRSHPDQEGYAEQQNLQFAEIINAGGGNVLTDERVRRFGSHHQKLVIIRNGGNVENDVAYIGGIDLCHARGDDERHEGDPQTLSMDARYGPRPAWHDIQLEVRGPAVNQLAETFWERWNDSAPLERRILRSRLIRRDRKSSVNTEALRETPPITPPIGNIAVQILRTYPAKRPPFPFAPGGERTIARAYQKAVTRARSMIYLEDQYLWSREVAQVFADALRRTPKLRLIAIVPRYPDRNGFISGPLNRIGQLEALTILKKAGGDRVAIYDLENEIGMPIYVHGKLCVIDDVWVTVGSDNLNMRSWTHDSEVTCAILDSEPDIRFPIDPGDLGDGARKLPRDLRLSLWREHLGQDVAEEVLLDPIAGFETWHLRAQALDNWHTEGEKGPRPPGRARRHHPSPVSTWKSLWVRPLYRLAVDPDGRPMGFRRNGEF